MLRRLGFAHGALGFLFFTVSLIPAAQAQTLPPASRPANPAPQMPPEVKRAAQAFDLAAKLHRERKVPQAIAAYRDYLRLAVAAKLPPASALPAYVNLAQLYAAQGDAKRQADALREAFKLSPSNWGILAEIANLDAAMGRFADAQREAELVLKAKTAKPIEAAARFTLGLIALNQNDLPRSEKEFSASAKLFPANPQTHMNLALVFARSKKIPQAISSAETARKLAPKLLQPYVFLANFYKETKRYPEALSALDAALAIEARNPALHFERALLLQQTGSLAAALKGYLKTLELAPANVSARMNTAQVYYAIENYRAARMHYEEAAKLEPKDPRAWVGVGLSEMQIASQNPETLKKKEGFRRAEEMFRKAQALAPQDPLPQEGMLMLYERSNRFEEAAAMVNKRLAAEPENLRHYYALSRIYRAQRRPSEVVAIWKRYRARKPKEIISYSESSDVLEMSDRKPEALAEWDAYLAQNPKDTTGMGQRARLLALLRRNEEARKQYLALLAELAGVQPMGADRARAEANSVDAMRGLAILARDERKYDEAISWLQKAKAQEAIQAKRDRTAPNAETLRMLAGIYNLAQKPALAAKEYDDLSLALPNDVPCLYELAKVEESMGRIERAANAYRRAMLREKDPANALIQLGELLRRNNNIALEISEYEKVRDRFPKNIRFLATLASAYELSGQDLKALPLYRQIRGLAPGENWMKEREGNILIRAKRYAEARALYEKVLEDKPTEEPFYANLENIYVLEDRRPAFLDWLVKRLDKRPADPAAFGYLFNEMEKQKRADATLAYLDAFVEKRKTDRKVLETYAETLTKHFRGAKALAIYQDIAAKNPSDIVAQNAYLDSLDKNGKRKEATQELEKMSQKTDIAAGTRLALKRRLAIRYRDDNQSDLAIPLFLEVLKAQSADFQVISLVTPLLEAKGREEELAPIYGNILKMTAYPPTVHADVRRRLGAIAEKRGTKAEAISHYREALKLDPEDVKAKEALKRLGAE